jgi:hypothetical protein
VLADSQRVRYVSRSPAMRDTGFWVQIGLEVPRMTVLGSLIAGNGRGTQELVPYYRWTNNECAGLSDLCEEALLTPSLSQGVSLLWADELDASERRTDPVKSEEDDRLPELDGQLRFGKKTRRR